MGRILLFIQRREDRQAIRQALAGEHQVIDVADAEELETPCDLCVVDPETLHTMTTRPSCPVVTHCSRDDSQCQEKSDIEKRFRVLFENSQAVMWVVHPLTGDILDANFAALHFYGYSLEELRRLKVWDINMLPREQVIEKMRQVKDERPTRLAFQHRLASGEIRDVEVYSSPVRINDTTLLYSIIFDVTARKCAEEERECLLAEVQRRAAELEATFNAMADGVVIYSPTGEMVRMNAAAERVLQYPPTVWQMPHQERLAYLGAETVEGTPFPVEESPLTRAAQGEVVEGLVMVFHPGGGAARWVSVSAAPFCDDAGTLLGLVAIFTDITALHSIQQLQEDLLHIVSHDLRNPLTIIQGHAQLLARMLADRGANGAAAESLAAMQRGITRMGAMIEDLVDVARSQSGRFRVETMPVDLKVFLDEMLQRARTVLDVSRIVVAMPPHLPRVLADAHRLERVLTNLLTNAQRYASPGTSIVIRVCPVGAMMRIAVEDQGPGIPPGDLEHLFERFYRAGGGRHGEGLGLGLYISKLLVEAQGGAIGAVSEVGTGSTFFFTLPLAPAESARAA